MTFTQFADRIKSIFQNWDIIIDDNTIKISRPDIVDMSFIFSIEEFNRLQDANGTNASSSSLELYVDKYYEVLLQTDSFRYSPDNESNDYHDIVNNIKYHHGAVSENLAFWLLYNGDLEMLSALLKRSRATLYVTISDNFHEGENSLIDFTSQCILRRYSSLVIKTESNITLTKAQSYMYSYVYTYMYNMQDSLYPLFDIMSLFPQRRYRKRADDFDHPKKTYNQALISYYNEAILSTILPHKYLSFYHILEYFYENIFMEDQISKAREIITDVGFSHKRNKDIAKLIKSIQSKAIDKDVAINEKTALSLLIQKHIPQELLKEKLTARYGQEYLETLKHKVEFSDGNIIVFSEADEKQYIDSLTGRIYKTRNAIVHSKESFIEDRRNNKYQPTKNDGELFQEIALIQVVAEIIINDSAKDM